MEQLFIHYLSTGSYTKYHFALIFNGLCLANLPCTIRYPYMIWHDQGIPAFTSMGFRPAISLIGTGCALAPRLVRNKVRGSSNTPVALNIK